MAGKRVRKSRKDAPSPKKKDRKAEATAADEEDFDLMEDRVGREKVVINEAPLSPSKTTSDTSSSDWVLEELEGLKGEKGFISRDGSFVAVKAGDRSEMDSGIQLDLTATSTPTTTSKRTKKMGKKKKNADEKEESGNFSSDYSDEL